MNNAEILAAFYRVADANGWHHHHTPKNLATAISVEAAELLTEFQWETGSPEYTSEQKQRIANEMADVGMYLLVLADKLKIDLDQAMADKCEMNKQRFISG